MESLLTTQDLHEKTEFSLAQDHLLDVETALPVHDHIKETTAAETGGSELIWMDAASEQTIVIIVQTILLVLFCVFGTMTNSLVFWVFNRRPALRSLSNRFVLSLVTANILISSIIAPLMLFEGILNDYLQFPCITEVISMIGSSVIFSAIFSTLLIATDRFYAVTSPLHYSMTITRSRSQVMIVAAWLAGTLLAIPDILKCQSLHQSVHVLFIVLQLALGYLFPFVGLCWLYLRMYHAAHRNSERTRKHSISGELLTVLDGSTSVIPPQGIDFLTHYINPFTKMVGSANGITGVPPQLGGVGTSIGQIVPVVPKKQRRRSSNGSSSSLLFREEGRAIKTAGLVIFSFIINWTPYFAFMLISEIDIVQTELGDLVLGGGWNTVINNNASSSSSGPTDTPTTTTVLLVQNNDKSSAAAAAAAVIGGGADWARFFGVLGILVSCLLNPFIYVFRNKMACKEVSKLLCRFLWEKRRQAKADAVKINKERTQQLISHHNNHSRDRSDSTPSAAGSNEGPPGAVMEDDNEDYAPPKFTPCIGKSPKRSSLKSLTPQSSLNSTNTTVNSPITATAPIMSSGMMPTNKPPFLRSMTVPEQTQPRVKFPPNLIRQKSCVHRPVYGGASTELTPALSKRSKFVRQDSICSILSNDSVLMICAEDSLSGSAESGLLNRSGGRKMNGSMGGGGGSGADGGNMMMRCNGCSMEAGGGGGSSSLSGGSGSGSGGGGTPLPLQKNYLRQDSNFSDASHKTNDSGVVLSMCTSSTKPSAANSPRLTPRQLSSSPSHLTPTHHINGSSDNNASSKRHQHDHHHHNGCGLQTTI